MRSLLLLLLGIPIPIIILIALFVRSQPVGLKESKRKELLAQR